MVPESATAVVSGDLADLQAKLDAFVAEHKLRGELQEEAGKYKVTIIGNQPTVLCLLQVSMVRLT